jgi:hypothetical protein
MTERTEAHLPDNWAGSGYADQLTRELLALVADRENLDAVLVRQMIADAWQVGREAPADAGNPFAADRR